jgi:hypothetical protein
VAAFQTRAASPSRLCIGPELTGGWDCGSQRTLGDAEEMMTAAVAGKCVEVLRQLRGITATYRMTNKPLPTRHSHFVPGVLAPLKAFVGQVNRPRWSCVATGAGSMQQACVTTHRCIRL